jgi:hypothetical protein
MSIDKTKKQKATTNSDDDNEENKSSRRDFLLQVGIGLNVVAGAMVGIPVAGYIFLALLKNPNFNGLS